MARRRIPALHCTGLRHRRAEPSSPGADVGDRGMPHGACRSCAFCRPTRSVRYGRFPGGAARGELRMLIPTRGTVREPRTTTAATVARTRRASACAGAGGQHACDLLRAGAAAALNGARIGWPLGPRGRDGVCALQPNAEVSSEQLRESPFAPTAACMAHTCQGTHAGWVGAVVGTACVWRRLTRPSRDELFNISKISRVNTPHITTFPSALPLTYTYGHRTYAHSLALPLARTHTQAFRTWALCGR